MAQWTGVWLHHQCVDNCHRRLQNARTWGQQLHSCCRDSTIVSIKPQGETRWTGEPLAVLQGKKLQGGSGNAWKRHIFCFCWNWEQSDLIMVPKMEDWIWAQNNKIGAAITGWNLKRITGGWCARWWLLMTVAGLGPGSGTWRAQSYTSEVEECRVLRQEVKLKVSRAHNDATLASISPDIRCPPSIDTL